MNSGGDIMDDKELLYWLYASIDELIDFDYKDRDIGDEFIETREPSEISSQHG